MTAKKLTPMTGRKFGRWTVISIDLSKPRRYWFCQCECGTNRSVAECSLKHKSHPTRSCGCGQIDAVTTHGCTYTRTYMCWRNMISRCDHKSTHQYYLYGGRGITYSKRWKKFENFLTDMGECPANLTLDRVNPNGNYSKRNCRWATTKQQAANKRTSIYLKMNGLKLCISEWARITGIGKTTLKNRKDAGWSDSMILNTPTKQSERRK
jgi:hypothetical protein